MAVCKLAVRSATRSSIRAHRARIERAGAALHGPISAGEADMLKRHLLYAGAALVGLAVLLAAWPV